MKRSKSWAVTATMLATTLAVACGGKNANVVPTASASTSGSAALGNKQPAPTTPAATSGPSAEATRRSEEDRMKVVTQTIYFDYDRAEIRPDQDRLLREKLPLLRENVEIRLVLEGHADERGSIEYNRALGLRRAQQTKDWLVAYGLTPDRFSLVSFGEERPADSGSNERAWAKNRRVEFRVR